MNREVKQAVILAGGRGERLRPLTDNLPKPMVLVNGRPFLEYHVASFKRSGIEEIVLLVGYHKEKIIEHFGDGRRFGLDIKYHIGAVENDTATRIRNAKDLLAREFILAYGDIYWPFLDLKKMSKFYHASGKMALMVVYDNKDGRGEQGFKCNVMVGDGNRVLDYAYGPHADDARFNLAEVGIFMMNRGVTDFIPENGNFNLNKTTLPDLVSRNELIAWKTNKVQDTITTPKHVLEFANKMKQLGL